jgi:hypothetical protein
METPDMQEYRNVFSTFFCQMWKLINTSLAEVNHNKTSFYLIYEKWRLNHDSYVSVLHRKT